VERIQPEAELVLLGLQCVGGLLGRRDTARSERDHDRTGVRKRLNPARRKPRLQRRPADDAIESHLIRRAAAGLQPDYRQQRIVPAADRKGRSPVAEKLDFASAVGLHPDRRLCGPDIPDDRSQDQGRHGCGPTRHQTLRNRDLVWTVRGDQVVETRAEVAIELDQPRAKASGSHSIFWRSATIILDSRWSMLTCISADGGTVPVTA
jgi:hypothetical protein